MRKIAQKSCAVLEKMGPSIQWVKSYVTDDKLYCVYIAPTRPRCVSTQARAAFPPTGYPRSSG